ncbi:unnamed protein product [Schistocephalus solidus]|uniref:Rho-GAP domain-containing protein n=1 Tax=Schistocephalus solidus TaxID=70667 RepID=A0A183TEU1_SCHSO|nr:unnamed protein product [Schistocephalus solidus]
MKLSLSFTEQTRAFVQHPSMENSDIFGLSLAEVIRKDQLRSERLQKVASALRAEKITGMDDALAPSGVCVPIIVSTCAEEIERRGLTEEGIYRISGSLSSVNYLKDQFNRDVDTAVKQLADYDVNVLTSLLKAFFRGLPEPLIKSNEFVAFVNALGYLLYNTTFFPSSEIILPSGYVNMLDGYNFPPPLSSLSPLFSPPSLFLSFPPPCPIFHCFPFNSLSLPSSPMVENAYFEDDNNLLFSH